VVRKYNTHVRPEYVSLFSANLAAVFEPFISPLECFALNSRNAEEIMHEGYNMSSVATFPLRVWNPVVASYQHMRIAPTKTISEKRKNGKGKSIDLVVKCRNWSRATPAKSTKATTF
jgi:hypothetical protein